MYNKDGGFTHCFREATKGDVDDPENYTGEFYSSPIVGWDGWPEDKKAWDAVNGDWGGIFPKILDSKFGDHLGKAKERAGDVVSAFDPKKDD